MGNKIFIVILAFAAVLFFGCKKDKSSPKPSPAGTGGSNKNSIYSDSVFFVGPDNSIVKPVITQSGTYSAIPDGLAIDEHTGQIEPNKSETGLKYKVTFTPDSGVPQTSIIIISGINYEDKIYNLSAGDSIAAPIYNADANLNLPGANGSSSFDESGGCKDAGIAVDKVNAEINLASTVRNQGIDTGATRQVKLAYRISDASGKALNGLELKIYFYRTVSEIPQYLTDLIAERKTIIFNANAVTAINQAHTPVLASLATSAKRPARPRPPCIIVVSR